MYGKKDDFFTFAEVLTGLKDELIKNRDRLLKLNDLTKVETNDDVTSYYRLFCSDASSEARYGYRRKDDKAHLKFYVNKKPNTLPVLYRKIRYRASDPNLLMDNASYRLVKDNNGFNFELIDRLNFGDSIYHPNISILDYEEFSKIYDDIANSKLFHLPSISIDVNFFQTLEVCSTEIELYNHDLEHNRYSGIYYNAENNKFFADTIGNMNSCIQIEDLLDTKIPKKILPEEYVEALDQNKDKTAFVSLDINSYGRRGYYTIEDNTLKLTRKKYL